MADISEGAFLRLKHIIGDPKANPPIRPIIPIGRTKWWQGVKDGTYPQPIKLGAKTTCWRAADIRRLVEELGRAS